MFIVSFVTGGLNWPTTAHSYFGRFRHDGIVFCDALRDEHSIERIFSDFILFSLPPDPGKSFLVSFTKNDQLDQAAPLCLTAGFDFWLDAR
jgi:hypothetical protein